MAWVFCPFCGVTNKNIMVPSPNNFRLISDAAYAGAVENEDAMEVIQMSDLVWKCCVCGSFKIHGAWFASPMAIDEIAPDWEPKKKKPCCVCGSSSHAYCSRFPPEPIEEKEAE